jgi:hypothetical protein
MSRFAKVFPQLKAGIPTAAVDCGVRATQSGLYWLSKGQFSPGVSRIREVGAMGTGPTNYGHWDTVIDTLGGERGGWKGVKTNSLIDFRKHLLSGGAAIAAVDYGWYRRAMPGKAGSKTFDGYHGITFVQSFKKDGKVFTTSTDSLLDGRYQGCPSGPVSVPLDKVGTSMTKVGNIYAVLLFRDATVAPIEKGELLTDEGPTSLADVLSDLYSALGVTNNTTLRNAIREFEAIMGFSYDPTAGYERIESGVYLPRSV